MCYFLSKRETYEYGTMNSSAMLHVGSQQVDEAADLYSSVGS
jgi:hypothetical protein